MKDLAVDIPEFIKVKKEVTMDYSYKSVLLEWNSKIREAKAIKTDIK
jgi:hypothetical protein